MLQGEQ